MKKIWEYTKLLVTIGFCVWILALVGGCASPTKGMTPEQKAEYIEQRKYEAADRLAEYQDEYLATKEWCDHATGYVMLIDYACRRSVHQKNCPPRHRTDRFRCVPARDFFRRLNRGF